MPSKNRNYITKCPRWTDEDVEYLVANYGIISLDEISKTLKRTKQAIRWKAMSLNVKYNYSKGLTEQSLSQKLQKSKVKILETYKGDIQSKFECPICKKEFLALPSHVFSAQILSCGCQKYNREHKRKGTKHVSLSYFHRILRGAKARNLAFNITIEYIDGLIIKQNFRCALSDVEIKGGYGQKTASLDRIDSSKGYIEGNVQWVHRDINWMKFTLSQEQFINYCRMVAGKQDGYKFNSSN